MLDFSIFLTTKQIKLIKSNFFSSHFKLSLISTVYLADQSINQPINQSINQSINEASKPSINKFINYLLFIFSFFAYLSTYLLYLTHRKLPRFTK